LQPSLTYSRVKDRLTTTALDRRTLTRHKLVKLRRPVGLLASGEKQREIPFIEQPARLDVAGHPTPQTATEWPERLWWLRSDAHSAPSQCEPAL